MIVVTGAAGFIGSCLIQRLNEEKYHDIIAVDDFSREDKNHNLDHKKVKQRIDRKQFLNWMNEHEKEIQFIFHLGARTDTTLQDKAVFDELNLHYTQKIWRLCAAHGIPVVYASSAATYGDGSYGYHDDHNIIPSLKPLNLYGESKNDFDKWALSQEEKPYYWVGLKFFNVYGPNEYHKGRMASVVYHAFQQIKTDGDMRLFRSHHPDYKDGEQMRDFIYVKDLVEVCLFLMHKRHPSRSGIYNLGSGKAATFLRLAKATFKALGKPEDIIFVDTPEDIRDKYQYFTEADMRKLQNIGYDKPFLEIEEGVQDYVHNYLLTGKYY